MYLSEEKKSDILNLTSLSHLRIARSKDGIHFEIDEHPAIFPLAEEESWGWRILELQKLMIYIISIIRLSRRMEQEHR